MCVQEMVVEGLAVEGVEGRGPRLLEKETCFLLKYS